MGTNNTYIHSCTKLLFLQRSPVQFSKSPLKSTFPTCGTWAAAPLHPIPVPGLQRRGQERLQCGRPRSAPPPAPRDGRPAQQRRPRSGPSPAATGGDLHAPGRPRRGGTFPGTQPSLDSPTRPANKRDAAEVLLCRCRLPPQPPAGATAAAPTPFLVEVWRRDTPPPLPRPRPCPCPCPGPSPALPRPGPSLGRRWPVAGALGAVRSGRTHPLPRRTVSSSSSSRAPPRPIQRGAGLPQASMSVKGLSLARVVSGEAGK